jgi:hypothetical protein
VSDNPKITKTGDFVRGVGRLIMIEIVPPPPQPPPKTHYVFEEIKARTEIRLGQEVIKEIQTLNDFYGEGTAVETSIEEAKDMAKKLGIGPKSELEIVVVEVREQKRSLLETDPLIKNSFYDKAYRAFKDIEGCGSRKGLPERDYPLDIRKGLSLSEAVGDSVKGSDEIDLCFVRVESVAESHWVAAIQRPKWKNLGPLGRIALFYVIGMCCQTVNGSPVPFHEGGIHLVRPIGPSCSLGRENVCHVMDGFLFAELAPCADAKKVCYEAAKQRQDDGENIPEKFRYQFLADFIHGCCLLLGLFLGFGLGYLAIERADHR